MLLSFLGVFYKRNIKTRCVILSRYNDTRDVERTLEKLVKHWAIASCFTSFSRVLSTPSCRYNTIKSRDSLIYFLNTERSHSRETPPALIRTTIWNGNCEVSNESVNCMDYPEFFPPLNYPYELIKEALVSLLYMAKTCAKTNGCLSR